ncbi:MAG: hypothetical protein RLZZ337_883 [Bacteroidota bacterium]|jgi:tetratricopeptide (TPR) repeat protein
MKSKYIIIMMALAACSNTKESNVVQNEKLYQQAIANYDLTTAKLALNQILLADSNNIEYKDSLCRLYIQGGNYDGGIRLAEQLINSKNADKKLLELTGVAYQQVGKADEAESIFNQLWSESKNYKYLYQIMVLQYEKGNQQGFDSLSSGILKDVETDSTMAQTTIDFPGPVTGIAQLVPIKAATQFLIGKNAYDREQNLRKAIEYYQYSIQTYDTFEMARYYLTEIARMQQGGR